MLLARHIAPALVVLGACASAAAPRQSAGRLLGDRALDCELRWDSTRLPLIVHLLAGRHEWRAPVAQAIALWPTALLFDGGETDLQLDLSGAGLVSIEVASSTGSPPYHGETTLHDRRCVLVGARIVVPLETPPALRTCVVAHELGHVLLLGHSDRPGDVMHAERYPQQGSCTIASSELAVVCTGLRCAR